VGNVTQLADTSLNKSQSGCGLAVILYVGANMGKVALILGV
jgi:hypothetical protein